MVINFDFHFRLSKLNYFEWDIKISNLYYFISTPFIFKILKRLFEIIYAVFFVHTDLS